jgi:hypothetical protein
MTTEEPATTTDFNPYREESGISPEETPYFLPPTGAIVRFPDTNGLGVLIGKYILTAANNVSYENTGWVYADEGDLSATSRGSHPPYVSILAGENVIRCNLVAVEPGCSVAVLRGPHPERYPEDFEAFNAFRKSAPTVRVYPLEFVKNTRIWVYGTNRGWVYGTVYSTNSEVSSCGCLDYEVSSDSIGGPVLTEDGYFIGVLTACSQSDPPDQGEVIVEFAGCTLHCRIGSLARYSNSN